MIRNYIKTAARNLRRQAGYSIINIGGLGLGLACAFMIVLFVRHELHFDTFHEDADRIYRVLTERTRGEDAGERQAIIAAGFADAFESRFPEIESIVLFDDRNPFLRVDDRSTRIGTVGFMGSDALDVFTFPLVAGDAATALQNPYSILLTRSAAAALFGSEDAMGRTVTYSTTDGGFDVTVTGILADVPDNSHLEFEALVPVELMTELMGPDAMEDFTNFNYYLYVLLQPGVTASDLEEKLMAYQAEQVENDPEQVGAWRYVLQPITGIHLTTDVSWDVTGNVNPTYLMLLAGIAGLILIVAGVNFINLTTARAAKRAREVGMRKAVGAHRRQLVAQFMGESLLLGATSVVVAIVLASVFLPVFRDIIGSSVTFDASDLSSVGLLIAIGLSAGALAGIYPALYVSAFRPAAVLKGELTRGRGAATLRKGMLVLQFCISIFLIIASLTVYRQLRFVTTQDPGFDREQVIYAPLVPPIQENFDAFRQSIMTDARVLNASLAGNLPGRVNTSRGYNWPGQDSGVEQGSSFYTVLGDYDYLDTIGLELIAGRDFSRDRGTDFENAYILNETAVSELGYESPEDAVGGPFRAWDKEMGEIIGVVRDFNFQSLHQAIGPVVVNIKPWIGYAAFRVAPGDFAGIVSFLGERWGQMAPGYPFDYRFLDEDFNRLYRAEQDLGKLFTFFSILAIVVACLGLFGLSAYAAERRRKEMSIRKVLGASASTVVAIMSREFLALVLVGFVLAAPVAWFAMDGWLDDFAYRISLGPGVFLLSGLATLLIAQATVCYQAVRAALVDPAEALRNE